jgi:hypothetical protein
MDFFETPEEVARQLEEARARLKDFEDSVDSAVLLGRLRATHPFHPTLIARLVFLLLALAVGAAAIASFSAPLAIGIDALPEEYLRLERNLGVPLPLAIGILSALCFVAWFGASQAALLVARDCPLMPNEQREHERLVNDVKRLGSQKAIMDRVRGTPMGARPRTATPAPVARFGGSPAGAPLRAPGGSTGGDAPRLTVPTPKPVERTYTPPVVEIGDNAPTPRPAPARGATPLGAPPRAGSVVGGKRPGSLDSKPIVRPGSLNSTSNVRPGSLNSSSGVRAGSLESKRPGSLDSGRSVPLPSPKSPAPARPGAFNSVSDMRAAANSLDREPEGRTDRAAPARKAAEPKAAPKSPLQTSASARLGSLKSTPSIPLEDQRTDNDELLDEVPGIDEMQDGPTTLSMPTSTLSKSAPLAASNQGFEQKYSTHFPKWGTVDEPWLEDAIQKSEILATGFPVQARLQFSSEPNLPFALVLERATPAMAVRAMVSFVEFLASISTPPKARIVLRSVPHLDRSFHRNVEAALEPYFGDKAQVIRDNDKIEIKFLEWDTVWKDHPFLPFEG